jgi:hypothetical protein
LINEKISGGIVESRGSVRRQDERWPTMAAEEFGETVMRYLLLIYSEESTGAPDPVEGEKVMNEYWAYSTAVSEAGVNRGGDALQPSSTATTVRVKDGERIVTDGPFAETREVLGGYYLLDVPDLDAALDWAARCPGAKYGSIEVRPIMEFDTPDGGHEH